ncbi:selenocysteine insertion sequence-binding protein 2-like isoform X2 [Lepisosteus oculatus]|uniref:selenocysteine insertion sequence-binding protein 2-like isoform X2 n=1 Tax=Lepisosteus oculatus TaxID=7918 RepID=UPI0007402148|nr:PREDICTED: selenocysteine insertion sequence-binding protein 2-like isoform X2 [Lepisosteus oculatus]
MDTSDNKDVKLSAEVEPFVPQKKGLESALVTMSLPGDGAGGSSAGGAEPTAIPSYLITCYPFVQENQPNRQLPLYNGDLRWQQPNPGPGGPYLAYPILPSPQPAVSSDYTYYQIMPAPCPPMMGFYQPFPAPYAAPVPAAGMVSAVAADCGDRPAPPSQAFPAAGQRGRGVIRPAVLPKLPQPIRSKRPPMRSVAVQKEISSSGPDGRSKTVLLVDASQQTDFPGEIASKSLLERASPLPWKSKARRRRASQPAGESSSEHGASEADIDSDSGYCSPKHNQAAGPASRTTDSAATAGGESGVATAVSWVNVASQVTQKNWMDRSSAFLRAGRGTDLRNYTQAGYRGRAPSTSCERGPALQTRRPHVNRPPEAAHSAELYFEDEDEFPELVSGGNALKIRNEQIQPKLPKNILENLPENSPISIVQTPIPITTSVPKRAKSQRKKALAAALATAQEYSEISMEQKKLQEALTKAAGKKSKTPVQLDLGDMLAALERQQQAMKARQLTNTKPLSYTVGTTAPFQSKDSGNKMSVIKSQPYTPPHNILDSTAPRMKRGKEREIPKVKRPTALKKIILKEREVKKGKYSLDHSVLGPEEQADGELRFTDDQSHEGVSQEENGLSMPSDASLSPASQNSPYSITPVSQGSPASSEIGSPMTALAITKIHSRRFREYCNQVLSKEIDESVTLLLQELVRFQERVYQKDPAKAKAKRRLVMGLREVTKHMKLQKIKCVIISPNCEKIQSKGGLDEALYNVIAMAREQEIPFVFALGRKALGRCVNKLVPVSVVGIFNFSGAEGLFNKLVSLTEEARKAYKDMVSALEQEQAEEALKNVKKVHNHMGHSRNPSAASAISFCSVISEPISEVNEKEYETNWRSMVESSDGLEALESEREPPGKTAGSESVNNAAADAESQASALSLPSTPTVTSAPPACQPGKPGVAVLEKEEGRPDDTLEWASQQSTETGSLDGSCRDLLSSSITSTASTLVPGMLEEGEDEDEEDEEEDYTPEPISVEVPLTSRIESWVTEAQKTLENLQLGKNQDSAEEEEGGPSEEEELESSEQTDPVLDHKEQPLEPKSVPC